MFNTLRYAKMLEEVGFSRDQAETSVKILVEIMEDKLASKQDLRDLKIATSQDFKDLKIAINQDFQDFKIAGDQDFSDLKLTTGQSFQTLQIQMQNFRTEWKHDLKELEDKLTIRMGTMLAASIAILTAIQKLL